MPCLILVRRLTRRGQEMEDDLKQMGSKHPPHGLSSTYGNQYGILDLCTLRWRGRGGERTHLLLTVVLLRRGEGEGIFREW